MSTPIDGEHAVRAQRRLAEAIDTVSWTEDGPDCALATNGTVILFLTADQAIKLARIVRG